MTKAKAQTNVFAAALTTLSKAKDYNAANVKKIQKLRLYANDARVVAALTENNVDAKRFDARALYATEKCITLAHDVTRESVSVADFNVNVFAVMKTALNARKADVNMTKADVDCALLAEHVTQKDRSHIVFEREAKISAAAQVQQCIDLLKTLNVVTVVSANVFKVRSDSAILNAFDAAVNVDTVAA